jgi:hypothetical protein
MTRGSGGSFSDFDTTAETAPAFPARATATEVTGRSGSAVRRTTCWGGLTRRGTALSVASATVRDIKATPGVEDGGPKT